MKRMNIQDKIEEEKMKTLILEKLSKMEDLEQRKLLRAIMSSFFENLIDYQNESNEKLEKRIFDEVEDIERQFDIYATIISKDNIDPIDEFFFPIIEEDAVEKDIDFFYLKNELNKSKSVFFETIFLKYENLQLEKLENREFNVKIITNKGEIQGKAVLKRNQMYLEKIETIFKIFEKNVVPWRTINFPYLYKLYDVFININIDIESEIQEIIYDLEEYEDGKYKNMIPVWNIEIRIHKGDRFPIPVLDKVHYEHTISIKKYGEQNGLLVNSKGMNVSAIKKTIDTMTIISDNDLSQSWELYRIVQNKMDRNKKYEFEICTNARKENFINKYAQKQNSIIRTKAEIIRIIESFECSKRYQIEDIEIKDTVENVFTKDLNYFIMDDIRVGNLKKIMVIKFKIIDKKYLDIDIINFIVSEVQMYFPEYTCIGEII